MKGYTLQVWPDDFHVTSSKISHGEQSFTQHFLSISHDQFHNMCAHQFAAVEYVFNGSVKTITLVNETTNESREFTFHSIVPRNNSHSMIVYTNKEHHLTLQIM